MSETPVDTVVSRYIVNDLKALGNKVLIYVLVGPDVQRAFKNPGEMAPVHVALGRPVDINAGAAEVGEDKGQRGFRERTSASEVSGAL